MNKDLLIKLTKLANHNSNDHEANSAARRVCKMLEESNWNMTDTVPPKEKPSEYRSREYEHSGFDNIFRFYNEYFTSGRRAGKSYHTGRGTWADVDRSSEPEFKSTPPYNNKYYSGFDQQKKAQKIKRNLKCKTCKKVRETVFVGAEEVFECNKCQWTAYTRNKAEGK